MGRRQKQTSGNNSGSKDKPEEDEQKIKARREKTRLKVQAWRKKQRENKAKHEELKRVDRERRKDARLLKKQQSLSDSNLQQELRRKKREEMKRYRQKKKEKAALALSVNKSVDLRSPKTAELSRKKKEAVKRTQAWRMHIKLNESIQQECIQTDCEIGNTGSARDSPMNKVLPKATLYRQLKKVKEVLPNTPKRKAVIISKLIESPSTSKFLNRNKMIMTPDCRKKLELTDTVIQSVSENISEVKTRKGGAKKHAYNIICDALLKKYKRHRLKKYFKVSVKGQKPSSTWWETKQRKRRRDALNSPLKKSVKDMGLCLSQHLGLNNTLVTMIY